MTVTDDMISKTTLQAVKETNGVHDISTTIVESLHKSFLGSDNVCGIKVNQDDDGVTIDVHVIINFGEKIPSVAWDIQENVKSAIESNYNLIIKAVNIHVEGVEKGENHE